MTDAHRLKPARPTDDTFYFTIQLVISVSAIGLAAAAMILALFGIEPTFALGGEVAGVGAICGVVLAALFR